MIAAKTMAMVALAAAGIGGGAYYMYRKRKQTNSIRMYVCADGETVGAAGGCMGGFQ